MQITFTTFLREAGFVMLHHHVPGFFFAHNPRDMKNNLHFDTEVAELFGINSAIIYQFIKDAVDHLPNDHEDILIGKKWKFFKFSAKHFNEQYKCLSKGQIKLAIDRLIDHDVLMYKYDENNPKDRRRAFTVFPEIIEYKLGRVDV